MLNTKEISAPGPHLARTAPVGIHPIALTGQSIVNRQQAWRMRKRQLLPRRPASAPAADPRAWMKSPLYWVAQTSSDLHLRRDFPRYKTMLDGWDSQSLSWQANKAAMAEPFGVTTKDLRRE